MNLRQALKVLAIILLPFSKAESRPQFDQSTKPKSIPITPESARTFGIDYKALQDAFSNIKQTQHNETYFMRIYEDEGYINFSTFDGFSFDTNMETTAVETNTLGT